MRFSERVYMETMKIPRGRVATYSQIAVMAGSPGASRAVGNILNKNRIREVPCHRVVRSDRTPGGFALGTIKKISILEREGIVLEGGRIHERFFI